MTPFPQITDEDYQAINAALEEFLSKSEAMTALLVEKAGYLIVECGEKAPFDTAELATLASNAFNATQFMADRLHGVLDRGTAVRLSAGELPQLTAAS